MPLVATSIMQIATIAIPAKDQERSLAFYVDVLGFEKT
jgi:catechol 2,3-dioxygenase-like lactoylglutathione lyase family enzyme